MKSAGCMTTVNLHVLTFNDDRILILKRGAYNV